MKTLAFIFKIAQFSFTRLTVCSEALVVFLELGFDLAVRYRLPRRRRIECPSFGLVRELFRGGFFLFAHRFVF